MSSQSEEHDAIEAAYNASVQGMYDLLLVWMVSEGEQKALERFHKGLALRRHARELALTAVGEEACES